MDCNTPGFPVLNHFPEFAQSHVHYVSDAIQPSHPLSSSSPPAFNLSQRQSFPMSKLFASGSQSIGVSASTSVPPMNTQDWSPFRMDWLDLLAIQGTLKSLLQLLQSINSLALSLLYGPTLTSIHDYWRNHTFDYMELCQQSKYLCSLIYCLGFL